MHTPSPLERIYQHLEANHPDVKYRFIDAGLLIDQEVKTDWGYGVRFNFRGLVLRYKKEGTRLTKRDGSWASDKIAVQAAELDELKERGYIAQFAVGVDDACTVIDSYLAGSDE